MDITDALMLIEEQNKVDFGWRLEKINTLLINNKKTSLDSEDSVLSKGDKVEVIDNNKNTYSITV